MKRDLLISTLGQIAVLIIIVVCMYFDCFMGLALLFTYMAGWCDGLMDNVAVVPYYNRSIMSDLNPLVYRTDKSWIWKYKDGDIKKYDAFWGSTMFFTALTDYWHFIKTVKIVLIGLACLFYGFDWYVPLLFFNFYLTGKQLMWNLILPKRKEELNWLQKIAKLIIIIPFYYLWNLVTKLSNKNLRLNKNTDLRI